MLSQERIELVKEGKGMLFDTSLLRDMRGKGHIARIACPELLELDVSELKPEDAAERIVGHVRALMSEEEETSGG